MIRDIVTGEPVARTSLVKRAQMAPATTPFGTVLTRRSPFDSFDLQSVRKVIARSMYFDPTSLNGWGVNSIPVVDTYLGGMEISVSSMDPVGYQFSGSGSPGTGTYNFISVNRAFLAGDHWQGGAGWAGPWPRSVGIDGSASTAITDIQKRFVSWNVMKELLDRHVTGVLGREPHWALTPRRVVDEDHPVTDAEQALIDEATAALTAWWDVRKGHELLQTACAAACFAKRGVLRIFVPRGQLSDVITPEGVTVKMLLYRNLTDAMLKLWVDHPAPERATVAQDEDTKEQVGALLYESGRSITGDGIPIESAELTYLDPSSGATVLRTMDRSFDIEWSAQLGGRLLMYEIERPLFLTPQLQQKQRALNLALSMLPRNMVTSGFLERILLNAQMPGHWTPNPTTGDPRGTWVPDRVAAGPGIQTFYQGVEQESADGSITRATPQVHDRMPIDPKPTLSTARAIYETMLEEAAQAHVLMNKDAGASGKSREQARADYERSLTTTAPRIERAGRWLIETLLALSEALTGQEGKYTDNLRAVFTCRIDTGPVDALERAANDASYKSGTLSREGAMARNGVADVDAEIALMDAQPGSNLDLIERMTEVWVQLVGEGADPESAAKVAGFSAEDIKELMKNFVAPPDPVPPPADGSKPPNSGDKKAPGVTQ